MNIKWKESDLIVDQMIKGSTGELWGNRLEQTSHYPLLKKVFDIVGQQGLLIDLGCGAGDVSRVWNGKYLGIDLDWVIERVAKVCNPSACYASQDIQSQFLAAFPKCKCVLLNALLDVLEKPEEILRKICKAIDTEFVIVHRQKISDQNKVEYGKSYGDSVVAISTISMDELNKISQEIGIKEIKLFHWEGEYYTFILRLK
jgi:hypothetical protein